MTRFNAARYHRNGVAGAGFYAIDMQVREGCMWRTLHAIVFDAADHVAVIDDEGRSWRCEDFEADLRAFIDSPACHRLAWPEQAHLIPCNEA